MLQMRRRIDGRRWLPRLLALVCCCAVGAAGRAATITVAAAADLRFAMDEIVAAFEAGSREDRVEVVFGSSGKLQTQIQQGAPYDLFFSADIDFPRRLAEAGFAASEVKPYGLGRIVLWSASLDATRMTLETLADPAITRIAIANPQHAPYGKRAEEALRASGLWEKVAPKLVFGENIAQAAQFVETGNAQVGILALSLVKSPQLAQQGGYWLVPASLHAPLEQGYVVTKRAEINPLAHRFAAFMDGPAARAVMTRFGFELAGDGADAVNLSNDAGDGNR
ncbi:MAG: molybdate transport system substrate-binding protein [Acidobacteriota bacterium]|nr:molybdate transport system substrate-binding protein [Acidobacteriota bacterium]